MSIDFKHAVIAVAFACVSAGGAYAQTVQNPIMVLPPSAAALSQALEASGSTELYAYYEENDFAPIWSQDNSARMLALVTAIENAGLQGIPSSLYDLPTLESAWAAADDPRSNAELEVLAARTYIDFVTDVTSGLLEPHEVSELINITPHRPEVADLLAAAAADTGTAALYQSFEPTTPSYAALKQELANLQEMFDNGDFGPKVPEGRTLRPGHNNSRVLVMRERLQNLGYPGIEGDSTVYDADLVAAVKQFQTDNALTADGIVGPRTLQALNTDPSVQMQQVIVNLERRRWLNYPLGDRHIFVNQASFFAYVMDYDLPTLVTRVVVGKPSAKYQTPEFVDEMTHMMVNPSWNVPESIASQEYLPQLQRDPSVLVRQNIRMMVRGTGQSVDARLLDMSQYSQNNFPFVLRQAPGRGNALGRVKFMFPNQYNVYLHDTPSKSLFNRETRAYSHGCVRVQRPFDLAHVLLAPQEEDPEAAFQRYLNMGSETRVDLETPVPIYLTYQSVFLDEEGNLAYRVDVYGRDKVVFDALAALGVTLPEVES